MTRLALKKVFNRRRFWLTVIVAVLVFLTIILLPNISLIKMVLTDRSVTISDKFNLLVGLSGSVTTNLTPLSALYGAVIAVFVGINVASIAYLLRSGIAFGGLKNSWFGLAGLGFGTIGVGCAACGPIVATAVLGTAGGSLLASLPYGGFELSLVGLLLLGISNYLLLKRIASPAACKLKDNE